ncbi:hypothetical protein [Streptomyces bohaiensis]|uniref:DUF2505 domain-containing protein n=1 Tax=Streptomyces bohaiensis TaxID=1431344 RepID=A0ABX1C7X7_9ACTN|nr:hypothetical protein [Streptomyces bohaiensis]NJQ14193.1 hypothetical protein [Streptomyces bohaiensis]
MTTTTRLTDDPDKTWSWVDYSDRRLELTDPDPFGAREQVYVTCSAGDEEVTVDLELEQVRSLAAWATAMVDAMEAAAAAKRPTTPAAATVEIAVDRDGWSGELQLSVGDDRGGYRLAGPKFNGSGTRIVSAQLRQQDADRIREYLDVAFPRQEPDAAPA